ncbi:acyl-CoA/acyl-ACP dehydrogenase [Pseudomaricurvus alkylphenolicus]|uniref:acyl-CoA dehydrogenase family protein n=1 Tax=Pseudomaricurvus alkylphenolicus TaxID=1306991 RepID=UPI00141D8068|nr:acyl-CoA dehydrogenase family protein [Pseudomaricurvus alkylphenolicus]NIB38062.1 acyl-CoA/acyl-ACP dehydrogenase [Pseudomaricurvus alkylphenolicus]
MNFEFSEDQNMIREQARGFLAKHASSEKVREILDTERRYDESLWQGIAELGWTAAAIPEAYGGLALGHLSLCVIAEELGRSLAPVPFSSSIYQVAEALLDAGTEAQKQTCLPKLATGEWIGTFACSEGNTDPLETQTVYRDGRLYGTKRPVTDGDIADIAIVTATIENQGSNSSELTLFLVHLDSAGVERQPISSLDPTRASALLSFNGVKAEPLGATGTGAAIVNRVWNRAAVLLAFEQLGGAQACLEMSRQYAMDRFAFGRPIASLQAIKHKLADMYTAIELLRSNALYAAWALSVDDDELPLAAATARVAGIQTYYQASKENMQTHGGMGFTWEFDCHLHYRRAHELALCVGNESHWKRRMVAALKETRNGF